MNKQIVLAKRPVGMVTESCFETAAAPVPELGEGQALMQVEYLGIDPTIRGWINEGGNYFPGVVIGEPVRSNGIGRVVVTNDPETYPIGRAFTMLTGWQEFVVAEKDPFPPYTIVPEDVSVLDVLSVLGHVGLTAYLGVLRVAKPQEGETFCVSAAASSVGSVAGQIAKMPVAFHLNGTGGVLLDNAGYWGEARVGATGRKRIHEILRFEGSLNALATQLRPDEGQRAWLVEAGLAGSVLVHDPEGWTGGWLGFRYSLPVTHADMIDPQPRAASST
jgi:hypothetical protein